MMFYSTRSIFLFSIQLSVHFGSVIGVDFVTGQDFLTQQGDFLTEQGDEEAVDFLIEGQEAELHGVGETDEYKEADEYEVAAISKNYPTL